MRRKEIELGIMKLDFLKLLKDVVRWRSIEEGIKKEYFSILTRRELDLIGIIENEVLPKLIPILEELSDFNDYKKE